MDAGPTTDGLTEAQRSPPRLTLRATIMPALAFLLVISMTAFAVVHVTRLEQRTNQVAFESAARDRAAAVRREFATSQAIVESIGSFFDASRTVTDEDFSLFVDPLLGRHRSISGIGWVPRIKDEDRERHELAGQQAYAGYQITERLRQGEMVRRRRSEEYFPVRFVIPFLSNEAAVGFDLASDAVRRASLEEAGASGELTSTAPVRLVQEENSSMSILFYRPIYPDARLLRSETDRKRDFSGVVSAVFRADDIVQTSLESLAPMGLDFELVDVTDPSNPALLARHWARTRTADDIAGSRNDSGLQSESTFEIAGRQFRLEFSSAPGAFEAPLNPGVLALLAFGTLLAFAIAAFLHTLQRSNRRARSHARQLQRLSQGLITMQENERHHLARELHDHFGQDLTALRINMHMVSKAEDDHEKERIFAESDAIIDRVLDQVRSISLDLRPTILDDLGLEPALHSYLKRETKRSGLELDYECDPAIGRLPEAVETATFRFSQEAVTNVVRHARASRIHVALRRVDGELELAIADDGIGFDPGEGRDRVGRFTSCGLLGMQERVTLVSGKMQVESRPGAGSRVKARIPIS